MWSIIASMLGWLLGKLLGKGRERKLEKKYAEAKKENLELRAKNAGLRVVKEIDERERKVKDEWENADNKERYKILKRDFDSTD